MIFNVYISWQKHSMSTSDMKAELVGITVKWLECVTLVTWQSCKSPNDQRFTNNEMFNIYKQFTDRKFIWMTNVFKFITNTNFKIILVLEIYHCMKVTFLQDWKYLLSVHSHLTRFILRLRAEIQICIRKDLACLLMRYIQFFLGSSSFVNQLDLFILSLFVNIWVDWFLLIDQASWQMSQISLAWFWDLVHLPTN